MQLQETELLAYRVGFPEKRPGRVRSAYFEIRSLD